MLEWSGVSIERSIFPVNPTSHSLHVQISITCDPLPEAMEKLAADQNNTSALLIAHNGLAKLLKGRWPWLLGGVMDAPRLLAQLCRIFRDGLDQVGGECSDVERTRRLVG